MLWGVLMVRSLVACLVAYAALSGCSSHRLVVANPNPVGIPATETSTAYLWGAAQRRTATCEDAGMDEVLIKQTLGDTLLSIVTLGIVNPIKVRYVCRKTSPSEGSTDEGASPIPLPGGEG